jgi:hypothetical protein
MEMVMIGRILSAMAGRSIARNVGGPGGGMRGMAIGAALPTLARRMGPRGMIAAAAGGYAVKRMLDNRRAQSMTTTGKAPVAPYRSAPTARPR